MKFISVDLNYIVNVDCIVYAREIWNKGNQHIIEFKDTNGNTHQYNGTLEEFVEEIRRTSEDG